MVRSRPGMQLRYGFGKLTIALPMRCEFWPSMGVRGTPARSRARHLSLSCGLASYGLSSASIRVRPARVMFRVRCLN
jgi:hypothetical protein